MRSTTANSPAPTELFPGVEVDSDGDVTVGTDVIDQEDVGPAVEHRCERRADEHRAGHHRGARRRNRQLMHAVVLVGGFGTRLRPLTEQVPKPMLPIGHVPMIERLIRRLARGGVTDVVLALGLQARTVRRGLPRRPVR